MIIQRFIERKLQSIVSNAIDNTYLQTFLQIPTATSKLKLGLLNMVRKKNPARAKKTNNSLYKQGVFKPKNSLKFEGTAAVYRSSYELKFFRWCDENPNVVKWGSENIIIPYVNPNNNKPSRYFVDNFIILKEGDNIKRYLIEIKPKKHTSPPDPKRYRNKNNLLYEQAMFNQNQAKWAAAEEWSKRHGAEFVILTEKELNI